ncbi:ABC transporter substrate-binding protein [Myxococcus faecalis]|uniref:ABC transporter substrate-binding protein n=1 Tax=Myxococcus TaxID=32 RepID=UPI001CBE2BCC|nr:MULTISPECIES: ABC transporter substrate-binding protein [Myxococcus]MBZ4394327.1 ABC transporter substrate-binding protein [Myxococcus sp. AS-1-15]MBZ4410421.1 ABC transporter substrate-binding protein [Myxococcus sp. XM-1-1-1]MCK8503008.1 ABC transporter substrate-binding protein [Myxococcus fulvus]BDT37134.1 ABC transporter substrate-binding protein [Myxococcus sp. MH1]
MSVHLTELLSSAPAYPRRVVCMTEETTEVLYRIGAGELVVGVSGFTVRPPEARKKPRVSSFLDANFERILELKPDLVLGFSDLQADLGRELCKRGVPVYLFNQRSVAEILQSVRLTGALVGRAEAAEKLAEELTANLTRHADAAEALPRRPRIFFEEWHEPLISGIRWCSELVELVGGEDVCRESRASQGAKGRIFEPEEVARRNPDGVIASWCGRKAKRDKIAARPGWEKVTAVVEDQLYEVKSSLILQPGPAALSDGVEKLARIVSAIARGEKLPVPKGADLRGG